MKIRKKIIENIFYYQNPKKDLIYDIVNKQLLGNVSWEVDLYDFLNNIPDNEYDLEMWKADLTEYNFASKNENRILYYKDDHLLISLDTKEEYIIFIDIIKANKGSYLSKKEIISELKPYVEKYLKDE